MESLFRGALSRLENEELEGVNGSTSPIEICDKDGNLENKGSTAGIKKEIKCGNNGRFNKNQRGNKTGI